MTPARIPLSSAALAALAAAGWAHDKKSINKTFIFKDFGEAMGFMVCCAGEIEKRDHHPEWSNVYNRVAVSLTTHDAGGVTAKDGELAGIMDRIAIGVSGKKADEG